jgi:hypothetical protein
MGARGRVFPEIQIIYDLICKYIQLNRINFEKLSAFALTRKTSIDIINDKLEIIVYKHASMLRRREQ